MSSVYCTGCGNGMSRFAVRCSRCRRVSVANYESISPDDLRIARYRVICRRGIAGVPVGAISMLLLASAVSLFGLCAEKLQHGFCSTGHTLRRFIDGK
jgi:hypothetical protein